MKFKKLIFLILIGVLAMALVACSSNDVNDLTDDNNNPSGSETNFSLVDRMLSDYGIEGEHRFFEVGIDEALQLLEDETFDGILYFGFPDCPWCQVAVPIIHEASQQTNTDIFYVSRRHEIRDAEGWEEWDIEMAWWLDEQIEMNWIYDEGGEPYRPNIFVPQVIHLRNGTVIDDHRGTFEGNDPLIPLTPEQHEGLLEIYTRILSAVK